MLGVPREMGGKGNGPNAPKLKDKFREDPILPLTLQRGGDIRQGIQQRISI